jgi:hypothetical protein
MITAEMATYGYDQINQARAEPNTVSKSTISETGIGGIDSGRVFRGRSVSLVRLRNKCLALCA